MTRLAKHPVLCGLGIILTMATLVAYPLLLIPALMAPALWYGQQWYDRRTQARATHRRMLTAHADFEHHALIYGDSRGTYGRYPPYC